MKSRKFIDRVTVYLTSGSGGNGCVSFRREKFVPKGGPDGGDGGRGGDIVLLADRQVDSLVQLYFTPHQRAPDGGPGKGKNLYGRAGKDLVIKVPCGTQVSDPESGEMLFELLTHDERQTIARGGKGGLGNTHWKGALHQAPTETTPGEPGEERTVRMVLKLISDVALVGFPNAGKSSLLSRLSDAHPKIGAYPFTTLNPIIGTIIFEDYVSLRVADIPGLLDGAHRGVGLGHDFLRHIERAPILCYVLDMAGYDGRRPEEDYASLKNELALYNPELPSRPSLIVANKMDLPEAEENLAEFKRQTGLNPLRVSAEQNQGIDKVKQSLAKLAAKIAAP